MMMKDHICITDLNVCYGKTQALQDISVSIPRNAITVIFGPSGCGKSTLLKSMNRFIELTDGATLTGKVLIDRIDIHSPEVEVTEVRKRIGLLAQRPHPLPMSIYDNVAYGLRIHGKINGRDPHGLVQHYLELAGLWDEVKTRLNTPATDLSIGQQQRLCLARGLAVEPEILLGDEPTSALDPISARHIEEKFRELKQQYTIVLVTHILRQAKRLADYAIFLYLGKLVECGLAEEVFGSPKSPHTRAYLEGEI